MKLQLLALLAVTLTFVSAHASTTLSGSLKELQVEVQKQTPGAYCFQASLTLNRSEPTIPLTGLSADFAEPQQNVTYVEAYYAAVSSDGTFPIYTYTRDYVSAPLMGGTAPGTLPMLGRYVPPKPKQESADLHPSIAGLKMDIGEIQNAFQNLLTSWADVFPEGGRVTITTIGRLRGHLDEASAYYYNSIPDAQSFNGDHVLVIFQEARTPSLATRVFANYYLYDGETGKYLGTGQKEVLPPSPPPPGAVSSGGR